MYQLNQGVHTAYRLLVAFLLVCGFTFTTVVSAEEALPQPVVQVDVNDASAEELADALVGIGLKKAQAIVAWREANGEFSQIQQLLEVKGVGEGILAKNEARITLK